MTFRRTVAVLAFAAVLAFTTGACHLLGTHDEYVDGGAGGQACTPFANGDPCASTADCNDVCTGAVSACDGGDTPTCLDVAGCEVMDLDKVTLLDSAPDPDNVSSILLLVLRPLEPGPYQWALALQNVRWLAGANTCNPTVGVPVDLLAFTGAKPPTISAQVRFGAADTYVAWSSDQNATPIGFQGLPMNPPPIPQGACHVLRYRAAGANMVIGSRPCDAKGQKGLAVHPLDGMLPAYDRLVTLGETTADGPYVREQIAGSVGGPMVVPYSGAEFHDISYLNGVAVIQGATTSNCGNATAACQLTWFKDLKANNLGTPWQEFTSDTGATNASWVQQGVGIGALYTAVDTSDGGMVAKMVNDQLEWGFGLGAGATIGDLLVTGAVTDSIYLTGTFSGAVPVGPLNMALEATLTSPTGNGGFLIELDASGHVRQATSFPIVENATGLTFDTLRKGDGTPLILSGTIPKDAVLHLGGDTVTAGPQRRWLSAYIRD